MINLKTGCIDNRERKFVSVNNCYLDEYLNNLEKVEEYNIIQTYRDGVKYRKIYDIDDVKYTKNTKQNDVTKVDEITEDEYEDVIFLNNNKVIEKFRKRYTDKDIIVDVDYFSKPSKFTIVEVSNNSSCFKVPKGLIEVTDNERFFNINIFNGSIIKSNIILEGTDGVGKTSTIKELLKYGIICQDRSTDVVSKNMLFDIDMNYRANKISNYLKENDIYIIILVNNDKEKLEARIYNRGNISDFDLDASKYNKLYLDTYNYMKSRNMLHDKLFLADCSNLDFDQQVSCIKKLIDDIYV